MSHVAISRTRPTFGALDAVEEGLRHYPGDARLAIQLINELEPRLHDPVVRDRFKALVTSAALRPDLGVTARFVEAVIRYYDGQFSEVRSAFREIREMTVRRATTRVRVAFKQPDGSPIVRLGTVRSWGQQRLLREHETGVQVPLDNSLAWERLGRPATASYQLGFSLAGPRAIIVAAATP